MHGKNLWPSKEDFYHEFKEIISKYMSDLTYLGNLNLYLIFK